MNARMQELLKPGPIFLAIWLIGYLIWAFFIPGEWDAAVRQFLLENRLGLKIYNSLGIHPDLAAPWIEAAFLLGLALILTMMLHLAFAARRPRTWRDLF